MLSRPSRAGVHPSEVPPLVKLVSADVKQEKATTTAEGAPAELIGPYLAARLADDDWRDCSIELIAGGRSNLTYLVSTGAKELVLRRPPLGHVLPTAHDMTREYRILGGLHDTNVPVPAPLHLCTDTSVLGVVFYVMERLHGHIVRNTFPPGYAETAEEQRRIGEALVDTLVDLHSVDWRAAGLDDFGHPDGFMARQLRRWKQQWERSVTRPLASMDELIDGLESKLPESQSPTIVHGDFRLDNTILDAHQPGKIVGVLDWEMSTIGDPLADLGLLLVYWPEPSDNPDIDGPLASIAARAIPGFPSREEVALRYATRRGRDVSPVPFYVAFGFFKLAVILEGIHARYLQGKTVGDGFESIGERVPPLVAAGHWALAYESDLTGR
jgi:aminoglycoside phosphotransferase (APT) family kinase protein